MEYSKIFHQCKLLLLTGWSTRLTGIYTLQAKYSKIPDFHRETAVIIGDSLTSDIQGGINAGIRTIWFNPNHEKASDVIPDYKFDKLLELPGLLSNL